MREAHDIAFLNLVVAGMATLAATTAAFSHDDTFHKILVMALWWVIFVRFTHTNRIKPKQFQEETE
ncbi:hypothetical protein QPX11_10690 [Corynebacterium propinquum]|uniref:hypothetical protein n=1 Tax=Corynebacterium propinquum TaxID=43769 RepID=UPI002543454E|nr:hypothetical protein [Corynebacterium propinquum]MDK4252774.1 hypothetical protein [Corynebacterium propinquum]